jgi:two-component system capsular synthesis response regulator RcsB
MFKKVLIAEDHESSNISVRKTLEDFGIANRDYVYYCDDALMRVEKALSVQDPYDLLITDLHFEEDHCPQQIEGGVALIKAVRALQPEIKILVFSAESKTALIDMLFEELNINAYVRKARYDVTELKKALEAIESDKKHLSTGLRQTIREKNTYEFSNYDITIISLLSNGMMQKEIPNYLEKNQIKPSGLSSVEKRLNFMKEALDFTKNEQLIAFCKDIGVI